MLYANIGYEVGEFRRDMKIRELADQEDIGCTFIHGKALVEPGTLFIQQGKPFAVSVPRVMSDGIGLGRRHGGLTGDTRPSSRYPESVPRRGGRRDGIRSECAASCKWSANAAFL